MLVEGWRSLGGRWRWCYSDGAISGGRCSIVFDPARAVIEWSGQVRWRSSEGAQYQVSATMLHIHKHTYIYTSSSKRA